MTVVAPGVWCDPCIAPIVQALNSAGLATVASCCGHGRRPGRITFVDGREMLLFSDRSGVDKIGGLWPGINDEPITAQLAVVGGVR